MLYIQRHFDTNGILTDIKYTYRVSSLRCKMLCDDKKGVQCGSTATYTLHRVINDEQDSILIDIAFSLSSTQLFTEIDRNGLTPWQY